MKLFEVKLTRFIPGPAGEVFDVWFDHSAPGDRGTARRR